MGKDIRGKELGQGYSQMQNGLYRRSFRDKTGKQQAVYGKTLKECQAAYSKKLEEMKNGILSTKVTLDAYYEQWFDNLKKTNSVKVSTLKIYETAYRVHIAPALGKEKIVDITSLQVKKLQSDLLSKKSAAVTNYAIIILHNILESAVSDNLITRNPASIKRVKKNQPAADKVSSERALTAEEVAIFMKYVDGKHLENAIKLLFATGMRTGELRALRWSDYDTKNKVIHIRRNVSRGFNYENVVTTPKTASSVRDIPVNKQIAKILTNQRKKNSEFYGNVIAFDDYIFKTLDGEALQYDTVRNTFTQVFREMKRDGVQIDHFSPHACRHTFISNCLHQGMNLFTVQDIVGHCESSNVTTNVYLGRDQNEMKSVMNNVKIAL